MTPFNWTCNYCGQHTTITNPNYGNSKFVLEPSTSEHERLALEYEATACPNEDCKKLTLTLRLQKWRYNGAGTVRVFGTVVEEWNLLPRSRAKPLPSYIPQAIVQDYTEACLICADSPKASATLSRRCLQGIVRDFWELPQSKRGKLHIELEAIKERVDPDTWGAIDAIRSVGNIGAHMEKDIDVIVDVDAGEAELLIELIEMLIADWYVQREKRRERTQKAVELAEKKKAERKPPKPSSDETNLAAKDDPKDTAQ